MTEPSEIILLPIGYKIKTKFVKKNTKKEKIKEENKQSIKEFPTGNE